MAKMSKKRLLGMVGDCLGDVDATSEAGSVMTPAAKPKGRARGKVILDFSRHVAVEVCALQHLCKTTRITNSMGCHGHMPTVSVTQPWAQLQMQTIQNLLQGCVGLSNFPASDLLSSAREVLLRSAGFVVDLKQAKAKAAGKGATEAKGAEGGDDQIVADVD